MNKRRISNWPGARDAAREALVDVIGHGNSLSVALPKALERLSAANERAFAQSLAYGVLRFQPRLERALLEVMDKPLRRRDLEVQVCLLLGVFQLEYLGTPDHAAVSESVRLLPRHLPWARGLTNAVLRRLANERTAIFSRIDAHEPTRLAHPIWLVDRLKRAWPDHYIHLAEANNEQAPMHLRVNAQRTTAPAFRAALEAADVEIRLGTAETPHAVTLATSTDPRTLPGYEEGHFSVQDKAAQLAATLLAPKNGERVLDACAAPGGKATHLAEVAEGATIVAVESDADRAVRLRENTERLRHNVQIVIADAGDPDTWWDGQPFDRILLDVPCSATGVIRRHPDIKVLRRAADIRSFCDQQARLLRSTWPLLAAGGHLLYATCSVLTEENSAQLEHFVTETPDAQIVPIAAEWGRPMTIGRQILPGEKGMDGFYYALLRKEGRS